MSQDSDLTPGPYDSAYKAIESLGDDTAFKKISVKGLLRTMLDESPDTNGKIWFASMIDNCQEDPAKLVLVATHVVSDLLLPGKLPGPSESRH